MKPSLSVHQTCGRVVDSILQSAAIEKSFDNLTIVMIAFKNLLSYHIKGEVEVKIQKNIKINEEETNTN
jgi:hypothetical protein